MDLLGSLDQSDLEDATARTRRGAGSLLPNRPPLATDSW